MCNAVSKLFKKFKSDEFYKNYIIEGLVLDIYNKLKIMYRKKNKQYCTNTNTS